MSHDIMRYRNIKYHVIRHDMRITFLFLLRLASM